MIKQTFVRECPNCGRKTKNENETICVCCGWMTNRVETVKVKDMADENKLGGE
jgi:ribosomal protein L37E